MQRYIDQHEVNRHGLSDRGLVSEGVNFSDEQSVPGPLDVEMGYSGGGNRWALGASRHRFLDPRYTHDGVARFRGN